MRYEQLVQDTLDLHHFTYRFSPLARITNRACGLLACREFGVYPMARRKKAGPFGAAEAITQIVYSKEANRSGEMG